MLKLNLAEFNITNVCNLNCPDCISFNNYALKGHQSWSDYGDLYHSWSKVIDIDNIRIVGGEPTLNPDFFDYVSGLHHCWPQAKITVVTNGTQLHKMTKLKESIKQNYFRLFVSAHGVINRENVLKKLQNVMTLPLTLRYEFSADEIAAWQTSYNSIADDSWPSCQHPDEFDLLPDAIKLECSEIHGLSKTQWQSKCWHLFVQDATGIEIEVALTNQFQPSAIMPNGSLRTSNPQRAIDVCCNRYYGTFYQGKLYKCSTTAVLPEFVKQFQLCATEHQTQLITEYQAANVDWHRDRIQEHVNNIVNGDAIPQCELCPENVDIGPVFEAGTKKVKFYPKGSVV